MSHDEFTKLYTYMQGEFKLIHEELDKKADKASVDKYLYLLDA